MRGRLPVCRADDGVCRRGRAATFFLVALFLSQLALGVQFLSAFGLCRLGLYADGMETCGIGFPVSAR